jgi:hypothetical protein
MGMSAFFSVKTTTYQTNFYLDEPDFLAGHQFTSSE